MQFHPVICDVNERETHVFRVTRYVTSGSVKEQINLISPLGVFGIRDFLPIRLFCMTLFYRQDSILSSCWIFGKGKNHLEFGIRNNLQFEVISLDIFELE